MTAITVGAPIGGWASALGEVPDPVFGERMMGDGLAIDPLEGLVVAPCDGTVIAVAPTRHSVTIELASGAQLLIHIGLETVALAGEGFEAHVADGQRVAAGDPLIGFDLDLVARRAKSLVTPIVVANEGFALEPLARDRLIEAGEPLFEVRRIDGAARAGPVGDDTATCELVVPIANGIHARPAARIATALKPFAAEVAATAHGRTVNARSTVALMGLGLARGDTLRIDGRGHDARQAVTALAAMIESGMDEPERRAVHCALAPRVAADGALLRGVCASPGLAAGPVARFAVADIDVPGDAEDPAAEHAALDAALDALSATLAETPPGAGAEIAAAHRALLDDPELLAAARRAIVAGRSAGFAWRAATRASCDALRATGNPLLIERTADLIDIERQLIGRLRGAAPAPILPDGAIVVAAELLPSQFMALDPARVAGIAVARGGPTSHVAILAASAGVPMLVALGDALLELDEGRAVVLDAQAGTLDPDPTPEALAALGERLKAADTRRAAEAAAAHDPCVTADGVRIEVFANLGSLADAEAAVAAGAEGCGLLRTEFLFLDRAAAPHEEEQRAAYAAIAEALGDRPLIVRTLDIGGDKPVPYLPFAPEENPALGQRGIRLGLARPDLLAGQLRAILRAVPGNRCRIMLPMIVEVAEVRRVRAILDEARGAVGREAPAQLGVMIETPAAALLADSIATEADFLSIGSNDLTQYTLAADRGNSAVAARADPLHPAVLRLIASAAAGAKAHRKWLGVCGGVASDPAAAAILIGLGATELSATPAAVPAVKAAVRRLRTNDCRALAERALACDSAEAVRALSREAR